MFKKQAERGVDSSHDLNLSQYFNHFRLNFIKNCGLRLRQQSFIISFGLKPFDIVYQTDVFYCYFLCVTYTFLVFILLISR